MTRTQNSKRQSTLDTIRHLRNKFEHAESVHSTLLNNTLFNRQSVRIREEEERLWAIASGSFNACELEEMESSETPRTDWRRQVIKAIHDCQHYIDEFHTRAVAFNLPA